MNKKKLFDSPIKNPDNDLLNVASYAENLAKFICKTNPPFTIGVYGEWGSGKTSFVNLVKSFLEDEDSKEQDSKPVKFITFSAWPYKTSDELWRAMILKIAEELYERPQKLSNSDKHNSDTDQFSWSNWLSTILSSDALVLDPGSIEPKKIEEDEYRELIAKIDNTLSTSIGKSSDQRVQLNQEETLLAFLKMVTTALSGLSPIVAALRSLFGLDSQIDPAKILQREKNEVSRDRIESMKEFREVLHELFQTKAHDKQVCVFLDDLDRCTPDIALDLLEAIKVFLGEVPCIFIIAADQDLIGQGLRLRFKDLLDENNPEQMKYFFSQKGQEYFEKIIQMPIRVPPIFPEQSRTFIVTQYPDLLSATDIIQTAIGTNPRRVKQYCNLLRYKYFVAQTNKTKEKK